MESEGLLLGCGEYWPSLSCTIPPIAHVTPAQRLLLTRFCAPSRSRVHATFSSSVGFPASSLPQGRDDRYPSSNLQKCTVHSPTIKEHCPSQTWGEKPSQSSISV